MAHGIDEGLSFERDIKGLFRPKDHESMLWALDLTSAQDVRSHASAILSKLADGAMPCDGAWPDDRIDLFRRWIQEGMQD
jgi:hypothetical protein